MTKTKEELEIELNKIEKKLNTLVKDFIVIRKRITEVRKKANNRKDNKKITDLKNKILSL